MTSPYCSPEIFAKKADAFLRFFIDFKRIVWDTKRDFYVERIIQAVNTTLTDSSLFLRIKLQSAFHLLRYVKGTGRRNHSDDHMGCTTTLDAFWDY
jgi:hypothetical protein